ncbi:MAG: GtrA family protein [Bacteroidales bacterium]|jgi:putative flippase GtrA|nr:GtrA family protein [Bacteroidales bacterium]MCI1786207.1 GtrA family protein [Bacteroidales bacterium]
MKINKNSIGIVLRFLKYSGSSVFGTIVDTSVLWLCSHLIFTTYFGENILSPVISFECSVMVNFLVSYFFIWNDRVSGPASRSFITHFGSYNASCTGVFLFKMGVLLLIKYITRWDIVICNLVALYFSGLLNFTLIEKVIFKKKSQKPVTDDR